MRSWNSGSPIRSGKTGCQLWDISSGREHGPVLEHRHMVCAMAISPDNRMLATGDVEGVIRSGVSRPVSL
jgi:WD40 repeat protein